jgi:DNA replication protein DnaC
MPQLPPSTFMPIADANRIFGQNLKFEEEFGREIADGFSERLRRTLIDIGTPPRLQKSNEQTIPSAIASLKSFQAFPSRGFGLVGPPGCGKSCAYVWAMKQVLLREFAEAGPTRVEEVNQGKGSFQGTRRIDPEPETQFKWVGWPSMTVHMKHMASRREWTDPKASTLTLIKWAITDPAHRILVLDDIGMENIKPESYTTEQLEILMDEMYNHEVRVFWTSNKTPDALERDGIYGQRLVSRLTGLSPDAMLPSDLPDLRIRVTE